MNGDLFFWIVKSNGTIQGNRWAESNIAAVMKGQKRWIRVHARLAKGGYDVFQQDDDDDPEVKWGKVDLDSLLEEAFRGKIIDHPDHPIIKYLNGKYSC